MKGVGDGFRESEGAELADDGEVFREWLVEGWW